LHFSASILPDEGTNQSTKEKLILDVSFFVFAVKRKLKQKRT